MKKDLLKLGLIIIAGLVFGVYLSTLVAPIVWAQEDPTPTCCRYLMANCSPPEVPPPAGTTVCYYENGCACIPGEWVPYAHCECY